MASTKSYSSIAAASEKHMYLKTLHAHRKLLGCKILLVRGRLEKKHETPSHLLEYKPPEL